MTKLKKQGENPTVAAVRITAILLLIATFSMSCKSYRKNVSHNREIQNLVEEIKEDNYMGTPYIARSTTKDPAYLRKQKLAELATNHELVTLASHKNPIVSLTAFQELYNRNHIVVSEVFDNYLTSKNFITFVKGDVVMEMSVLEFAYTQVLQHPPFNDFETGESSSEKKFFLSPEKQRKVEAQIKKLNEEKAQ